MKLSNQAMGALMMALQKSLLEQADIVPMLQSFEFELTTDEQLSIKNPPNFKMPSSFLAKEEKTTASSD
tara:strand:+ start:482 stop:688 length:207 start_codon:yes stop_codon:yes gene_type:complete